MIPNRHAMMGRKAYGDAVHVGSASGGASPIVWPDGRETGQTAILIKVGAAPAGWATIPGGAPGLVVAYYKQLTGTDITTPPTPNSAYTVSLYREPRYVERRAITSHQGPPGFDNNPAQLAFTKSPLCAGRLLVTSWPSAYAPPGFSGSWSSRAGSASGGASWQVYDHLNSAAFVSGTGVTTTWDQTDPAGPWWTMFEFTN